MLQKLTAARWELLGRLTINVEFRTPQTPLQKISVSSLVN